MNLIEASQVGDLERVKELVSQGVDNFDLALRDASLFGHLEVVKYLVEASKKQPSVINGADNFDEALRNASIFGHLEVVKYLVENGADNFDLALRLASWKGQLEVVKYLVEQGADIHAKNDEALRYASMNAHLEVVKHLVEHGADIHAKDNFALKVASRKVKEYLENVIRERKLIKIRERIALRVIGNALHNWLWCAECRDNTIGIVPRLEMEKLKLL